MAESIRGINIVIGSDMTQLDGDLKKINSNLTGTNKQLKEVEKGLKFDPTDTELLTAKQKLLSEALSTQKLKLKELENQSQAYHQSAIAGNDGALRKWQDTNTEILKATNYLKGYERQLDDVNTTPLANPISPVTNTSAVQLGGLPATKGINVGGMNVATLTGTAAKVATVGAIAAGATVAVGIFAKSQINLADEIDETANKYNISAEALQEWNFVAERSGVEAEKINQSFVKTNAILGDLATGKTNEATNAIEALGISQESLLAMSSDEAYKTIVLGLGGVSSETERLGIANAIFGDKLATEINPMLELQASEIENLIAKKRELGIITNEEAKAAGKANDKWDDTMGKFKGLFAELGMKLMPLFVRFVEYIDKYLVPVLDVLISALGFVLEKLEPVFEWISWLTDHGIMGIFSLGSLISKSGGEDANTSSTSNSITQINNYSTSEKSDYEIWISQKDNANTLASAFK